MTDTPTVERIDYDHNPEREQYQKTASLWLTNGNRVREVLTVDGRIVEQVFHASDPDSVWDDIVVEEDGEQENFEEYVLVAFDVVSENIANGTTEGWAMKLLLNDGRASSTNVEYLE